MRNKIIVVGIIVATVAIALFFVFDKRNSDSEITEENFQEKAEVTQEEIDKAIEDLSKEAEVLTKETVSQNIVGLWQSLDNSNYQVEFTQAGEMIEKLSSNQINGLWKLVSFNEGPNEVIGTASFSQEGVFLRQSLDEGKNHFYYKVIQSTPNRLVTLYLLEGAILGFDKVQ